MRTARHFSGEVTLCRMANRAGEAAAGRHPELETDLENFGFSLPSHDHRIPSRHVEAHLFGTNLSSEIRTSEASRFPLIPASRKRFIASI